MVQNLLIRKFNKWERAFSQFVNWKFLETKGGHTLFLKMHIISSYNNKMKARLFCIFATGWTRTNNNFFGQNPWVSEQYNITPYGCYDRTLLDFVKGFRLPNSFHVFPWLHSCKGQMAERNTNVKKCLNRTLCKRRPMRWGSGRVSHQPGLPSFMS